MDLKIEMKGSKNGLEMDTQYEHQIAWIEIENEAKLLSKIYETFFLVFRCNIPVLAHVQTLVFLTFSRILQYANFLHFCKVLQIVNLNFEHASHVLIMYIFWHNLLSSSTLCSGGILV